MPSSSDHSAQVSNFADEVISKIEGLAADRLPYHNKLDKLKKAVLKAPGSDYCAMACRIGSLQNLGDQEPQLSDYLRIELAHGLLKKATNLDATQFNQAKSLLASWQASESEGIRLASMNIKLKAVSDYSDGNGSEISFESDDSSETSDS